MFCAILVMIVLNYVIMVTMVFSVVVELCNYGDCISIQFVLFSLILNLVSFTFGTHINERQLMYLH